MSSQILKVIAAMMLIGSFVLIAIAYRLSTPPAPTEATTTVKPPGKTFQIVTATRAMSAGEIIHESDITLSPTAERPADALDSSTEVLGKRLTNAITQGKPVLRSDLAKGNPLVQSLKANERAIAIKVDEFIGVGGFIQPGDFVDVVAFIRGDNQRVKDSQAIVVLHAVRILSYGEEHTTTTGDKPSSKDEPVKGKTGRNTAVVALDSEQTSLIALIENSAVLRLALCPPGATDKEKSSYPITISDLVAQPTETIVPEKPMGPTVEIYHGTHVEQVQYP